MGPKDSSWIMGSCVESTSTAVGAMKHSDLSVSPPMTILPLVLSSIFFMRSNWRSLMTRE